LGLKHDFQTIEPICLGRCVSRNGLKARISWIDDKNPLEWKDCLGAAETIGKAKELLRRFLKQNKKARIKDLVEFNCTG
jgi:hypothetical protein